MGTAPDQVEEWDSQFPSVLIFQKNSFWKDFSQEKLQLYVMWAVQDLATNSFCESMIFSLITSVKNHHPVSTLTLNG